MSESEEEETIFDIAPELVSLLVKAGRRVSYDLKHTLPYISDKAMKEMFSERANYFLALFNMDTQGKDYRHRLHRDISDLEYEVKRLEGILDANGIEHLRDDIPF